ncbi:MAG: type VI secretion system tip protein VgrG [Bryobacterales bacterium]|nr:type VI secretion system tip protein VgrG [Bryobacterales bacterium]
MPFTQNASPIAIGTSLGQDKLLLTSFTHEAEVSVGFRIVAKALSEDKSLDIMSLIRTSATIRINLTDDPDAPTMKYLNGVVRRAQILEEDEYLTEYQVELVSWNWMLDLRKECRIFQNMTTQDIISKVFKDAGFNDFQFDLQGSTQTRVYCVQYRETHRQFTDRLMEEEGLFYWFKHIDGKHTMIIGNANSKFAECPKGVLHYDTTKSHKYSEDIHQMDMEKFARTKIETRRDYFFENPSLDLTSSQTSGETRGSEEIYDYPGLYTAKGQGDHFAGLQVDHQDSHVTRINFKSMARDLFCGCRVKIADHFNAELNKEVIVLRIVEVCSFGGYRSASGTRTPEGLDVFKYENHVNSVPNAAPYRPARKTPRPQVKGAQTAVVVGPSGEEIYTDKYGRIKVQFHWDRVGKKNQDSSCWIRFSTAWAGKNWGMISIPRIGQEVVVDFLEGDPDRPLVVGSVYNAEQMPPYGLPGNMTQSGLKSRSSKGGGGDNFNEIRFEDLKGSEELYIHAEKDMNTIVENDRNTTIQKGNDSLTIEKGNRSSDIQTGGRETKIKKNDKLTVQGNIETKADGSIKEEAGSTYNLKAGTDMTIEAGMNMTIKAGTQITIQAGSGKIVLNAMGVTITGALVKIN